MAGTPGGFFRRGLLCGHRDDRPAFLPHHFAGGDCAAAVRHPARLPEDGRVYCRAAPERPAGRGPQAAPGYPFSRGLFRLRGPGNSAGGVQPHHQEGRAVSAEGTQRLRQDHSGEPVAALLPAGRGGDHCGRLAAGRVGRPLHQGDGGASGGGAVSRHPAG